MPLLEQLLDGLRATTPMEMVAVVAGILSVWFSKKGNVWVYPIGLINTTLFIYLSLQQHLLGEASVNFYYTVMSIYGWWAWTRKDPTTQSSLPITYSTPKERRLQVGFFVLVYAALFTALSGLKESFATGAIPWADAFASATAYTGMWLMTRKKVESWFWWILTNLASIPLYFVKGYVFSSFQFLVLLGLAIAGWWEWHHKARQA